MEKYEHDIVKTMEIIDDSQKDEYANLFTSKSEGYSRIYPKSNEDLKTLFSGFDFEDKNVLSVLASSDQVFCSYYLGARSVDTFDLNFLAEHYYYLRKWLLEYKLEYYPDFKKYSSGSLWIRELLDMVECQRVEEEITYKYWNLYNKKIGDFSHKTIFKFCDYDFSYDLIVDDVSKMRDLIKDKSLNFTQMDITGNIKKRKKYDVIILSNILEYCSYELDRLERCRDNLFDMLEDGGEIITSHLMDFATIPTESYVFSAKFDAWEFPSDSNVLLGRGCCYTKKK